MASQPKRRRAVSLEKCIICQADKGNDILRRAKESSLETLKEVIELRKDEVFDRLHEELPGLAGENVLWHSNCYSSYTSQKNIRCVTGTHDDEDGVDNEQQPRASRSSASVSVDWSKCFICRNKTYKKDKKMFKVSTFEACDNVKEAAESKGDEHMKDTLISVNYDLIAADAQYHKTCFASYVSKSNLKHKGFNEKQRESLYGEAFEKMSSEIGDGITQGKAYDMNSLLSRYSELLGEKGIDGSSYTKQRLKLRLEKHFGNTIIFHKDNVKNRPEIIYSSNISVQDILNSVAAARNSNTGSDKDIKAQVLNLARHIKDEIRECSGISLKPLNADDVSLDSAKRIIPPTLYWLVRLLITSDRSGLDDFDLPTQCKRIADERQVVSIAQDIIHCASNSRIKLPKQIGLAMAVRQLTGSKQLVVLLNRMGHSSSYDELQAVDTCLATEVMARAERYGTVIPSNIYAGSFVQLAADNNDLCEETLDGKNTTHATTLVVYQKKTFGPELPPVTLGDHSQRRRSLKRSESVYELQECSAYGRRPQVNEYVDKVEEGWFKDESAALSSVMITDELWAFLRMKPAVIFETGTSEQEAQLVPSWSAFNAILYPDLPFSTKIGYCPMIEGTSTEFSTVYTVLKHAQKLSSSLGQRDAIITFDLAIYVKAKQIQMKFPAEFSDTVIRLGGFHIALNFLALLGKMFRSSGLEDLFIESGVYGAGTTDALMKGKSYNRGVRAHKLAMEAFYRLLWDAFLAWRKARTSTDGVDVVDEGSVSKQAKQCQQAIEAKAMVRQSLDELQQETKALRSQFKDFIQESSSRSRMFAFWLEYRHMIELLLQFVKAERVGDWELHLSSVSAMIPYYFAMDRQNYARWLPVYVLDMKQLATKHPNVHQEFLSGSHAVSRSTNPFAKVWTDMALEQSINADSKSKGGIVGISQNPGALDRWFLTSHERASTTRAVKDMFIDEHNTVDVHKEATPKRVARDEADVQKLISCFSSDLMSNPFTEDGDSLLNFATGVVLPPTTADGLVKCKKKGKEQMTTFIDQRLNSTQKSFWDPIPKLQVKTFESASKKVKVKAINEKLMTVGADRDLFGRLLIAANVRHIILKDVLCYELSAVPLSLAHEDGTLRKSTKSVLSALLESKVSALPLLQSFANDTVYLVDGMALVQAMKLAGSSSFGEVAEKYYKAITAPLCHATEVHVVFDQYWDVSIKAGERERRREQSDTLEVKIHGPTTPAPKQWTKYIPNPTNKVNLCNFLSESFCDLGKQLLPPNKALVIGGGFKNGRRAVMIRRGYCDDIGDLESDHEEADTRLLLHAMHASRSHPDCRVIVQSPDTDVLILSVSHFSSMNAAEFWFKTGIKDRLRYVPVHELSSLLGEKLCRALPSYHAITGCDSTSALDKVGKKKHWPAFEESEQHQESLGLLGTERRLSDVVASRCEAFVCDLYPFRRRNVRTTDELRYLLFCQKKAKNECLPPTSDSLLQHLKRANHQTFVWRKALTAIQDLPEPAGNGWVMEETCLKPVFMTKDPAPASLLELTTCGCKSGCETNCSCNNTGLSCSESCYCMASSDVCRNPHGVIYDDSSDESDDE